MNECILKKNHLTKEEIPPEGVQHKPFQAPKQNIAQISISLARPEFQQRNTQPNPPDPDVKRNRDFVRKKYFLFVNWRELNVTGTYNSTLAKARTLRWEIMGYVWTLNV
jgi:hypothetical protein